MIPGLRVFASSREFSLGNLGLRGQRGLVSREAAKPRNIFANPAFGGMIGEVLGA